MAIFHNGISFLFQDYINSLDEQPFKLLSANKNRTLSSNFNPFFSQHTHNDTPGFHTGRIFNNINIKELDSTEFGFK